MSEDFNSFNRSELKAVLRSELKALGYDGVNQPQAGSLISLSDELGSSFVYIENTDEWVVIPLSGKRSDNYYNESYPTFRDSCEHNGIFVISKYDLTGNGGVWYADPTTKDYIDITGYFDNFGVTYHPIGGRLFSYNNELFVVCPTACFKLSVSDLTTLKPTPIKATLDASTDIFTTTTPNPFINGDIVRLRIYGDYQSYGSSYAVVSNVSGDSFKLINPDSGQITFNNNQPHSDVEFWSDSPSWNILMSTRSPRIEDYKVLGNVLYLTGKFSAYYSDQSANPAQFVLINSSPGTEETNCLIEVDLNTSTVSHSLPPAALKTTLIPSHILLSSNQPIVLAANNDLVPDANTAVWRYTGSSWVKETDITGGISFLGAATLRLSNADSILDGNLIYYIDSFSDLYSVDLSTGANTALLTSITADSLETYNGDLVIACSIATQDDNSVTTKILSYDGVNFTTLGGATSNIFNFRPKHLRNLTSIFDFSTLLQEHSTITNDLTLPSLADSVVLNYSGSEVINLSVSITDPDNIESTHSFKEWISNIDGVVATGSSTTLDLSILTQNAQHKITTPVYDRYGIAYNFANLFSTTLYFNVGSVSVGTISMVTPIEAQTINASNFDITATLIDPVDGDISASIAWYLMSNYPWNGGAFLQFLGVGNQVGLSINQGAGSYKIRGFKSNSQGNVAEKYISITAT